MKLAVLSLGIASALTLLAHAAVGQSATASLRGVVTDATQAVVPGAEVEITSVDTAQKHMQRSDGNGEFSFQELFVGDYRVEVRSPGFATWVNAHLHLDVGNQLQIVVRLVATSAQQTIEVTAETARLQTNEIAQGAVVSEREVLNLPLNGRNFTGLPRHLLDGWQFNALTAINAGTPFTVFDSANVSLQAPHPAISGMFGDRPDVIGDPNKGPHKVSQWVSPSAFRRLDPVADAGQFGNEQRNSVAGPGFGSLDASLYKSFALKEKAKLQFRAEAFNLTNHANLVLPVDDMNSPVFGQITEAQSPRVLQFALKIER